MSRLRAFAQREPLIARTAAVYAAAAVAWAAAHWFGVELDQDVLIAIAASVLGLSVAVAREGVYSPASVATERARAADEALLHAPAGAATVVQVGADATHTDTDAGETVAEPLDAGDTHDPLAG